VALSSGLNIAQQAISVISGVFVARIVGPDVLGILAYAAAFTGLFTALSDLGLGTAHIKRLSEGKDLGEGMGMAWLSKVASLVLMASVILVVLQTSGPDSFSGTERQAVFYLALATLILTQLTQVPWTTLTAFQDVVRRDLPPTLLQVVNSVIRLALAVLGAGAVGLAGADAITVLLLLVVYWWLLRGLPLKWPSRPLARSYATFGAPMFVIALVTSVGERLDRVLLESFGGLTAVGQYAAGMRFGSVLQFLSQAVAGVVFPSMARAFAEGRRDDAFALCGRAERRLALVTLPLLLGVTALARPMALVLLGERFADTGPVIAFGTLAMIFQALTQPYRQLLGSADKTTVMVAGHIVLFGVQAACLLVLLGVGGIAPLAIGPGAPAAAAAVALSSLLAAAVWRGLAVGTLDAHLDRRFGVHLASGLGLFAIVYALSASVSRDFGPACLVAVAAVGLHLGILHLAGELGASEINFLRGLIARPGTRPPDQTPQGEDIDPPRMAQSGAGANQER
jgi:O-antigen/teichoic acid export membrane protein